MRLLIIGISGFVGPYLANEFLNNGYEVFGSDLMRSESVPEQVGFVKCNILDSKEVNDLLAQVIPDMIINLAAISSVGLSWSKPQATIEVNVVGGLNILEAARALVKKPKILFVGSSEEYEPSGLPISEKSMINANNPYGISKVTQESFATLYGSRYGLKIYCVRPFNHIGVGQRDSFVIPSFCKQVAEIEKSGKPGTIKVGNLSAERDFSDVRDVVRAYRLIIESDDCGIIYNVGSGAAYSLECILERIIAFSSQTIQIEIDPDRFRPIDTPRICCDSSLIRTRLNWKPEHDIFDTMREIFDYYCGQ